MPLISSHALATLGSTYIFATIHIIPGPRSWSYFYAHWLNIFALLLPPEVLSHKALAMIVVPIAIASTAHSWRRIGGPDGASVGVILWVMHTCWFEDVRRDYRLLSAKTLASGKVSIGEEPYPRLLLARIRWVLTLVYSPRLSGWLTTSESHNERQRAALLMPKSSRRKFAWKVILEQSMIIIMLMPLVQLRREAAVLPLTNLSWSSDEAMGKRLTTRFIRHIIPAAFLQPLTMGLYLFAGVYMNFQHVVPLLLLANFFVGLPSDSWSLHTQPPVFGSIVLVLDRGLAGLWGGWWHQFVRVAMSMPGRHVGRQLGYKDGSMMAYALQLLSAFFFSGLMHGALVPPQPLRATWPVWKLRLYIAGFFWIQTLGIAVELLVTSQVNKVIVPSRNMRVMTRFLRLIWVLIWLCLTLPILETPFRELMCWDIWPFFFYPESLQRYFAGEWLP